MPKSASHKLSECGDVRSPWADASLSSSSAALVAEELDKLASAHGERTSPHSLSLWLADLGIVRIESNLRVTPSRDDSPYQTPPVPSSPREEQATIVDE